MRILYSILWWVGIPFIVMRLWWRGRKEPGYRKHVAERLGFYPDSEVDRSSKVVWVHAVSVGETRAAEPLVEALLSTYPQHTVLLTHMTPTGRATGKALFGKHGARVIQSYSPYDIKWMVSRFIRHFSPEICILMETEVWPNMIAQCFRQRVPVVIANARLSERSYKKALRLSGLFREAASKINFAAAQTEDDAKRLHKLGVENVQVTGSVKFDVTPLQSAVIQGEQLRQKLNGKRVLLCASTREGEEMLILEAFGKTRLDNTLLVIVPRHPQRFDEVEKLIQDKGFPMRRRSLLDDAPISPEVSVVLGDSMGEMFAYYTACDLAFIGGSLLPLGGQNLIEACAVGKPVLTGPHTFNFEEAANNAIAAGAAIRVNDAQMMLQEAQHLLKNDAEREGMGTRARAFAAQHRGATQRTMKLLNPLLT
jgi:3-deoxy-D-manno-octulosonic-acid transferase